MCLCMYCNKFLTRKSDLQRHLCTHTGIKAFNCDVCRKKFSQKSALVRHSFLHTEKFKCDDCGKPFTRDSQLQNHIKKQHDIKNKSGMNSTCLYKFKSKSCIEDHLKLMNKSDFKCVICNKVFASKGSLYCHYLSPTQIKEVKCDKCEGEFSLNSLLIQHKLSKEGNLVEKFEPTCPECGNDFLISSLIQHNPNKIKIHKPKLKSASAAQGFNCSYCGKIFSYKCNLKVHLSTHTGARFSCELCKNSYSTKESLKHHILAHKGETPCTCPYCGKQFRKPSYYKHLLIHKGERRYECNICKKGFIRKDQLNQHLRVHKT
ncbi:hypothetical protein NQ314_015312 [Rhamnusium bicolor]|uniref:C2H2-type domain-containing protein n=1 Tax=Rhamnusium bicolor TaxID=1586634 RepID=A0AAV8WYS8_9CUCU|nr:hypothetical protein NQ314_015312 [Rhamnusium bicolor]